VCAAADRPGQPGLDADLPGDADRYDYPDPPASLSSGPVRASVRRHEGACRLNELFADCGRHLLSARVRIEDATTYDAPAGVAIAEVASMYDADVEGDDGPIEIDSPRVHSAYRIDDAVARRAEDTAHRTET
jgi:hypothetical protein